MPVTEYNLASGGGAAPGSPVDTASASPGSYRLQLLNVLSRGSPDAGDPTSVTGCGLTWTKVGTANVTWAAFGGTTCRITVYWALGASPTTGTLTVTWASAPTDWAYSWVERDGVDTTTPVVQSNSSTGGATTAVATTLAAFGHANNATYAACGAAMNAGSTAWTAEASWTAAHAVANARDCLFTEGIVANDTTPSATAPSTPTAWGIIALEIKAGAATAPEMDVTGNSVSIADGDATPAAADHTDFGDILVTATQDRTFTILNTGDADLTLSGTPKVALTTGTQFSVTVQPTSPVSGPSGTTTFTVRYDPTGFGSHPDTLSIANNDTSENPYNFDILGESPVPEIDVRFGAQSIPDGDVTPSGAEGTDFGGITTGTSLSRNFAVHNTSSVNLLTLSGASRVALSGANANQFQVTLQPAATVAAGASSAFQITFAPTSNGAKVATATIANDDPDEGTYDFALAGEGLAPPSSSQAMLQSRMVY